MGADASTPEPEEKDDEGTTEPETVPEDPPTPPEHETVEDEGPQDLEQATDRIEQLEERVGALESELASIEEENERVTETLARVQADYENYRKRAKRERREAARDARIEMIEVLLDVRDDVERALSTEPGQEVEEGLELVLEKVDRELDELGVERLAPEPGDAFDPGQHEPVIIEETDEHAPETVLEHLQAGYELDGRQIRPALVKVAKAPTTDGDDAAD